MTDDRRLDGRVIALPETRQLAMLSEMLESRGARVIQCPLVAIEDNPDRDHVESWLNRVIDEPPDMFVFYTGEGIQRLAARADAIGRKDAFVRTLEDCRILYRGPKPKRALHSLGISGKIRADSPTTEGIIETLERLDYEPGRIAVQLYGTEPVAMLDGYLRRRATAVEYVAPYIYASKADDLRVVELIERLNTEPIDAIAFTSKTQVERLVAVAKRYGKTDELIAGLQRVEIAAIGPVVAEKLESLGFNATIRPQKNFFMKPLVTALCESLAGG